MPNWTLKQNDTAPALTDTLTYSDGTVPALSGATVNLVVRSLASGKALLNAAASITNLTTGAVSYTPTTALTGTPGSYQASWVVTFSGGSVMTFPTVGYNSLVIEESLTATTSSLLVSLEDVCEYLNLSAADRAHEAKLIRFIQAAQPLIEAITGPILPQTYDEWYDGGQYHIVLRHRPSRGYGTTPLLQLVACSAFIGPIEYALSQVGDPAHGSIYSVEVDSFSRLVRRGPGGGLIPFPNMLQGIHVIYVAGQTTVPANVQEATLELLRVNYQRTQQASRRSGQEPDEMSGPYTGFFVPGRVKEMLAPTRRAPSIF